MSKNKKIIILVSILCLVLVAGVLTFVFWPKDKTATSIMNCSVATNSGSSSPSFSNNNAVYQNNVVYQNGVSTKVSPEVQFVLNKNNNVISVNYLNSQAEILLSDEEVVGKSAEDASNIYVQLCVEAGYIDVDTTGTTVNITLSCDSNVDLSGLQKSIENRVDKYFDDNGIIGATLAKTSDKITDAIEKAGVSASELEGKTTSEALAYLQESSEKLEDVACSLKTEYYAYLVSLKPIYQDVIKSLKEQINSYKEQINSDSSLSATARVEITTEIETTQVELDKLTDKFNKLIEEKIKELQEKSKAIFEQAKADCKELREQTKEIISAHKEAFNKNKTDVKSKIDAYRKIVEG
jgi:hypothetical protein